MATDFPAARIHAEPNERAISQNVESPRKAIAILLINTEVDDEAADAPVVPEKSAELVSVLASATPKVRTSSLRSPRN